MKKSQVWIETVIYTLIGLSIIGIVLGIVQPVIEERRDSISISQSASVLGNIDLQVNDVKNTGTGNTRSVSVKIGKGRLVIDGARDKIFIILGNSKYEYSEPNLIVHVEGNIQALTMKNGKTYNVSLMLNYTNKVNITYEGRDVTRTFESAPVAYDLWVKNKGVSGELPVIDFY